MHISILRPSIILSNLLTALTYLYPPTGFMSKKTKIAYNCPMNSPFLVAQTTLQKLSPHLHFHQFKTADSDGLALYEDLLQSRKKYYAQHAPHLLQESELNREKEVDLRSHLIAVRSKNKIIASLRLTSYPYELQDHDTHNFDFKEFENYLEIGRLVTDPDLDPLALALLVRYLLCGTGLFAFENLNAAGFVAICRPYRLALFSKFGLIHHFDVFSAQRKIHYCFMSGSSEQILKTTAELQNNEEIFRKRLERLSQRA